MISKSAEKVPVHCVRLLLQATLEQVSQDLYATMQSQGQEGSRLHKVRLQLITVLQLVLVNTGCNVKASKGKFLYSAESIPQDCSKLFTQTPSRLLWEASSNMLQLMREGCSYTYPPLSIARKLIYSAE